MAGVVKVQVVRTIVGLDFIFREGEVYDLPRPKADAAIKSGWAKKYTPPKNSGRPASTTKDAIVKASKKVQEPARGRKKKTKK